MIILPVSTLSHSDTFLCTLHVHAGAYRSGAEAGASGEVTAPTMEEFIARIPPKKRNTPISSEIQIGDIAAVMKDWELISGRLGLSEADVKCIKNDNHHDYMLQK